MRLKLERLRRIVEQLGGIVLASQSDRDDVVRLVAEALQLIEWLESEQGA